MSENGDKSTSPAPPMMGQGPKLMIELFPNGKLGLLGPIHDKGLCYMLLELARDAIKDYKPSDIQVVPPGSVPNNLLNRRG